MKIKKYQVDAFAQKPFEGNPAVVCPVENFLDDDLMQKIAMEHNLSETAFIVNRGSSFDIRWFTPLAEVELCGHATLASAFIIFEKMDYDKDDIIFNSKYRGQLKVEKKNGMYELDFPATRTQPSSFNLSKIQDCFNVRIKEHFDGKTDCLLLLEDENAVLQAKPDFQQLSKLDRRGFIITGPSKEYDFVSRFFGPKVGVNEDPVTGSAHTMLIPFWSQKFDKINMIAKQISSRGGILYCTYLGERVRIAGNAILYSEGEVYV